VLDNGVSIRPDLVSGLVLVRA